MKIDVNSTGLVALESMEPGAVFVREGRHYILTEGIPREGTMLTAVDLANGEMVELFHMTMVRPVPDAVLVRRP